VESTAGLVEINFETQLVAALRAAAAPTWLGRPIPVAHLHRRLVMRRTEAPGGVCIGDARVLQQEDK
jgi:hypothetical protein